MVIFHSYVGLPRNRLIFWAIFDHILPLGKKDDEPVHGMGDKPMRFASLWLMKRCAEFLLRQKGNMSTVILFWRFKSGRCVFIVVFLFFFRHKIWGYVCFFPGGCCSFSRSWGTSSRLRCGVVSWPKRCEQIAGWSGAKYSISTFNLASWKITNLHSHICI